MDKGKLLFDDFSQTGDKLDARQKMTHICARFIHLAGRPYMSLYQHMLVFMRLWQQSHFLSLVSFSR